MRFLSLLALSLLLSLLSACAPQVAGLQHDQSFSHQSVMQGGMAIASVSATYTELTPEHQNQLAEVFRRAVVDARKEYRVVPAGQLEQHLGSASYKTLIKNFQSGGVLSPADLSMLKEKATPARYLLLSRLENYSTRENREEYLVNDDKGKATDRANVSLQSIGEVTAFSNIYDLQQGNSVWSGSITQEMSNTSNFETYAGSSFKKALEDAATSLILGDEVTGREFPEPPELDKVAKKVFQGFAANLPKK